MFNATCQLGPQTLRRPVVKAGAMRPLMAFDDVALGVGEAVRRVLPQRDAGNGAWERLQILSASRAFQER